MTMDTTDLSRALRDATADLEPRPGFIATVVRSARRRRFRARAVITTSTAILTAIAGVGMYLIWRNPPPSTEIAADPRLTQPTGGDLSSDQTFVNAAARAWRDGVSRSWNADRGIFDDLRGQPHVYWADTTPAGPAAVVLQQAYFHPHGDLSADQFNTTQTLVGLVATDPADGMLKLVYDQYTASGMPEAGYFRFGPGDRTVLVVDRGTPLFFSPAPLRDQGGRISRDWQPMTMTDGVAIAQVPEGGDAADARVIAGPAPPAADERALDLSGLLLLEPSSAYLEFARTGDRGVGGLPERRLTWPGWDMRVGRPFDQPTPANPMDWAKMVEEAGFVDFGVISRGLGMWFVRAGLDDGRVAVVSELQPGTRPSQVYAVLLKPDGSVDRVIAGDIVDQASPLPVRLRMPDAQGWVVADYGAALHYRVGAGPWQDAGPNAALLPDTATHVQVTRSGTPTEVALPR